MTCPAALPVQKITPLFHVIPFFADKMSGVASFYRENRMEFMFLYVVSLWNYNNRGNICKVVVRDKIISLGYCRILFVDTLILPYHHGVIDWHHRVHNVIALPGGTCYTFDAQTAIFFKREDACLQVNRNVSYGDSDMN